MTSLVTRCPACTTLFKVVPDQLRISEGWVRCGQCDEVFDAQAHMQSPLAHEAVAEPPSSTDRLPTEADNDVWMGSPEVNTPPDTAPTFDARTDEAPAAEREDPAAEQADVGVADDVAPVEPPASLEPDDLAPELVHAPVPTPRFEQAPLPAAADDASDFQPSFLRAPLPQAASRKRVWLRGALVSLLGLVLLGQVVVQQRDRIAATEPALTAPLQLLCQLSGCEVGALQQIESIVIESSSFVKVKSDVYRLSFSIKNTALVPLALPSAELALTDLRDQTILRRVLAPAEYGARAQTLAPGEEQSLLVPVAVKAAASVTDKITGYRLLVFYP